MLREQLDQATTANQALTTDIHKLTQDWQRAREELQTKEQEWRDEEQVILTCDTWQQLDLTAKTWWPQTCSEVFHH